MSNYKLNPPKQAEAVVRAYHKLEDTVVGAYKKMEDTVVSVYKKTEEGAVNAYKRVEQGFVNRFLESVENPEEQEAEQPPRKDGCAGLC